MKSKLLKAVAATFLACGVLLAANGNVSAAPVNLQDLDISYNDEDSISVGYAYKYSGGAGGYTYVNIGDEDKIANVKSSSGNLLTKVTHYYYYTSSEYKYDEETYTGKYERKTRMDSFYVAYFAKKAGKYKVTFDVLDKDGKVKYTGTINVTAHGETTSTKQPVKKITYGGKDIWSIGPYTTKKSGKLKVSMNKNYKLVRIEVEKMGKDGKYTVSKLKNNGTLKLSTSNYHKYEYEYSVSENDDLFPYTSIRIYYKNTKTKEEGSSYYSLRTINPSAKLMY